MTNSYGTVMPQQNMAYQNYPMYQQQERPSVIPTALGMATLGFAAGTGITAGVDYYKNRKALKNGEVSDSLARKILDKMIEKDYVAKGKEFLKQKGEVLKGLKKVATPEEFTKLMKKFKKYASSLCDGITLDTMCNTVNKDNIKEKVNALIKRIEASLESEIQNIKDTVKLCWDSEKKKFVKPKEVDNKFFKIIKNTKNNVNWKNAFKYGGITAGVMGIIALGLGAMAARAQSVQQQYPQQFEA